MRVRDEYALGSAGEKTYSVIAIVGPTASGKTEFAQALACRVDGEVVSADSMQIYRGMDIGTGKLPVGERRVPHHGIDLCDPGEPYSAALFQPYARSCFSSIGARGKTPLLCGGTGLYVRAAIDEFEFPQGEQVENPLRERWTRFAEEQGNQALWEELRLRDPQSAELIHPNNVRRVVRAFEMIGEGTSYAEQHARLQTIPPAVPTVQFGLEVTPSLLAERIDARVDAMIEAGLVDEVEGLLQRGFRNGITAPQAIGYKEIVAALAGDITLDEAIMQIKTATRRYAKRQRTWFRKDSRILWLQADSGNIEDLVDQAFSRLAE